MLNETETRARETLCISRAAHFLQRTGLAMAGAMCGTFLGAYLSKAGIATFSSIGFIAAMVLIGTVAFYLGINIPGLRAIDRKFGSKHSTSRWDAVELLSAAGTFLAAMSALTSVYALVFDEPPQPMWEFVIGSWWCIGVLMQIVAGAIGRMRFANTAVH